MGGRGRCKDVGRTVVAWHIQLWLSVGPCWLANGESRAIYQSTGVFLWSESEGRRELSLQLLE